MPAAASVPNATTRIASVTGTEVNSARRKSEEMRSLIALFALPSPNSPTRSCGCARWTAAVAASAGATRSAAVSGSPVSWKVSSAERPSRESCPALAGSSGDLIAAIAGTRSSRAVRSVTAARSSARSRAPLRLWSSTCSPARSVGNSFTSVRSACRESPMP